MTVLQQFHLAFGMHLCVAAVFYGSVGRGTSAAVILTDALGMLAGASSFIWAVMCSWSGMHLRTFIRVHIITSTRTHPCQSICHTRTRHACYYCPIPEMRTLSQRTAWLLMLVQSRSHEYHRM